MEVFFHSFFGEKRFWCKNFLKGWRCKGVLSQKSCGERASGAKHVEEVEVEVYTYGTYVYFEYF